MRDVPVRSYFEIPLLSGAYHLDYSHRRSENRMAILFPVNIAVKCMKVVNLCKCCKFTDVTNVREIQDLAH